jgi:hypothetical protein
MRDELQNFRPTAWSLGGVDRVGKLLSTLAIVATGLTGCATGISRLDGERGVDRYRPYLGEPIDHFTAFDFQGWEYAGDNQVVIWTGVNEAYLLTVWSTCTELDFAQRIGVTSTGNTVSRMEAVRVGGQRCPIEVIQPIDIRAYKADRAAQREEEEAQARSDDES